MEGAGRECGGELGQTKGREVIKEGLFLQVMSISNRTVMCLAPLSPLSGRPVDLECRVEGPFIPDRGGIEEP